MVLAEGTEPENPSAWKWRSSAQRNGPRGQATWTAQGERIGWLSRGSLYLEPDAAYRTAQASAVLDGISVGARTLWKRLQQRGLLRSTDEKRKRHTIRVTLEKGRREVLHLHAGSLMPTEPSQSAQPSPDDGETGVPGPLPWDGRGAGGERVSQRTVPETPGAAGRETTAGPIGTVGTIPAPRAPDEWGEV